MFWVITWVTEVYSKTVQHVRKLTFSAGANVSWDITENLTIYQIIFRVGDWQIPWLLVFVRPVNSKWFLHVFNA